MIASFFKRSLFARRARAPALLAEAVLMAARAPAFYVEAGIPDTFDGRFELVALHSHLVFRRLRQDGAAGGDLAQRVFDYLIGHFDEALREIGVGDMSVGKRVKTMARGLYGRLAAYDEGLDAPTAEVLEEALRRNAYGTVEAVAPEWLDRLASFQRAAAVHLDSLSFEDFVAGRDLFPPFPPFPEGDAV